ncbi:alpha/beta hydrolase, partial [Nocardioides sp.]|uniref:alpha/beta hydrolase n=1 Tax=Nocardioides sp. TaxID=35761 RepID=UPI003564A243
MPQHRSPDLLGPPWLAETIDLPPDEEGTVVATLVSATAEAPSDKAVLHLHGFADYFFQTEYADWWRQRGYYFYALDLRKYGRSLQPHQTPNYATDLREYYPELDAAWHRITERDGHRHVVLSAHSTGGLTLPLWAHDQRLGSTLAGMVLNSPWFDMHGSLLQRTVGARLMSRLGRRRPRQQIPRDVDGFYARSLHRDHEGEWEFDLAWKPLHSWPVYAGWLRAVREGHRRLHRGLDLDCPTLVLSSGATSRPLRMSDEVHAHDVVLDVSQIRQWSPAVSRHVTYVAVE